MHTFYYAAFSLLLFTSKSNSFNVLEVCEILASVSENEISAPCRGQLTRLCENVDNQRVLWQIFDASSKFPISGMSYSSNQDLGNFDQCLSINYNIENDTIIGKFCTYSVAIVNPFIPGIPEPYSINLQDQVAKNDLEFIPAVSLLSMCIPNKCSPKEVANFFIWGYVTNDFVKFLDIYPCVSVETNNSLNWGDIIFTIFLVLILVAIVFSTVCNWIQRKQQTEFAEILLSFSLITNWQSLVKTKRKTSENITCLNGLRFISMMWVLAGHNFGGIRAVPLINYAEIHQWAQNPGVQYVASATIAVDTFFFISGLLMGYGYLKAARNMSLKFQITQIPKLILHRYLRLTPPLLVLYFGLLTVYRFLGSGPFWQKFYEDSFKTCSENWWSFFLYVQNYVNYNDMCINHTWYLSADMQMFILSLLVLIPLTEILKQGFKVLALVIIGILTLIAMLIPIIYRLITQSEIINTYDTHSRFVDYTVGLFLGVILREFRHKSYPLTHLQNVIVWVFILAIDVAFNLYYHHILLHHELISDILFNGLYRLIWSSSLAFMVYSCFYGYGGLINTFLSSPVFQIGARLSYCMYLLHGVIIVYWIGVFRSSYYWHDYAIFYVWCGHFIMTLIISLIWALAFEFPVVAIERFIFKRQ